MDMEEIMRRFGPRMTSDNTGEDDLERKKILIPESPQKTLDLHGLTAFEAELEARSFIFRSHDASLVRIRIVTGRGSANGTPVLYRVIGKLLHDLAEAFDWLKYKPQTGHYDIFLLP
jgi:DNA-nicking Smr family endonuclease